VHDGAIFRRAQDGVRDVDTITVHIVGADPRTPCKVAVEAGKGKSVIAANALHARKEEGGRLCHAPNRASEGRREA
jgi:hypothetical protein